MKKMIAGVIVLAFAVAVLPAVAAEKTGLPKGYQKWERSKEKVVSDKSSLFYGMHYIYVDKKAMQGYKAGGNYPQGSQFVVEQFKIGTEAGKPVRGRKDMIVLMKKDKKYQATGGWQFAGFTAEGKLSGLDPLKNCYECHAKDAAASDLVISKFPDFL